MTCTIYCALAICVLIDKVAMKVSELFDKDCFW